MAFNHGKDTVFYLGNYTATLTSITAYCDSTDVPFSADVAETTTFGKTQKDYVAGLKDGTISIEGPWDSTINAILASAWGASKEFAYGPAGSAGGSVKFSGSAICTAFNVNTNLSGAARYSASFQQNGTASITTW
jgi:predicted secreted protein